MRIVRVLAVGLLATAVPSAPGVAGAATAAPEPEYECTYDEGPWFWWLDVGQGHWECEEN
jgi:hypothetical protein